MTEISGLRDVLIGQQFVDRAVTYAVARNPALLKIDQEKVFGLARRAASEMVTFEDLARNEPLRIPNTPEECKRIKAIYDLSYVGTYLKGYRDDRYQGTPGTEWTDRRRLNYTATLIRRLTETITGNRSTTPLGMKLSSQQIEQLRSNIEQFGPYLIYGSTSEQNEDLEIALEGQNVIIPKSKVHIIADRPVNTNTLDQVQTISLPPQLRVQNGDILAVVAHAPHLVRSLHMLNRYKTLPKGMIVKPYPMPAPSVGGVDFAIREVSGLLYYTFITEDASEEIYPYQI